MDLLVLDELLRRTAIIDQYESLIWTERWAEAGDFELVIRSERGVRNLLPIGTRLSIYESHRVMVVEQLEDSVSDEGYATIKVTGPSLEGELKHRGGWPMLVELGDTDPWNFIDTPGNIARTIFRRACVDVEISPQDALPFYQPGTLLPPGSIPEPPLVVNVGFELDSAYEMIKKVCDIYKLGFRLVKNGDLSQLFFEVYTGDDRTTLQTVNDPVVFSRELDNLTDTSLLTSISNYKNVAYVYSLLGTAVAYADGVSEDVSGFDRRVLIVKVDTLPKDMVAGAELTSFLRQRGREALAEHRAMVAFDGETPQNGKYKYDVHYRLGDLVETRNSDGFGTNMRVTEQIFICDREGKRSYPTLSNELVITPGTWYSWDGQQVWDAAVGYWQDA